MNVSLKRSIAVVISIAAASVALSACEESVSVGGSSVSKSEIESKATEKLGAEVGQVPKSVVCPDDLDAKVGESETCVLTAKDGTTYDMTAKITSVDDDGGNVELDFQVANKPSN